MQKNKTTLVGNLGNYNTTGTSKSGQKYFFGKIKVDVAKDQQAYIEIRAYGKEAELLEDYSKTGEEIIVEGKTTSVKDKKVSELMNVNYYINVVLVESVKGTFKRDEEETNYNDLDFGKDDDLPF